MYCVIQQVMRKKPDPYGEYREIEAYQNEWRIAGDERPFTWSWRYTGGRFERDHMEAFKISVHHSYRENGVVRKHQYPIRTMSYYDIVEYSLYDCADGSIQGTADKLGMEAAELYEIIYAKLEPLQERLEAEFRQSAEYIAKQEHQRVLDAKSKARKQAEREAYRSYWESWGSNYGGGSSSYSIPVSSTYSEKETDMLKEFYKKLSKIYHPDLNPGKDTTAAMQLLNRLKESWKI